MVQESSFQERTPLLLILAKPSNRYGNSQLDLRLHKTNASTYWSINHILYIFLSFLSPFIILNLLREYSSCFFAISYHSMSCLIHFDPSLILLTWICFLSPSLSCSLFLPLSLTLPLSLSLSPPINLFFPFNYLSHPNTLSKPWKIPFWHTTWTPVEEQWSLGKVTPLISFCAWQRHSPEQ